MKKKPSQPASAESWEERWFALPYSMPPLDNNYLICPSCNSKEFICRKCGLFFIKHLLQEERQKWEKERF